MAYFYLMAATMFLFTVALVSALAVLQAYRDGRGARRSGANRAALSLWTLAVLVALGSGVALAWFINNYFNAPSTSW